MVLTALCQAGLAAAIFPHVVTIGDSTVANANLSGDRRGWGQMLPEYFLPGTTFSNMAQSGASAKSFYETGAGGSTNPATTYWALTKALNPAPDYLFIQFGTNDQQTSTVLHTDPATTFRDFLRAYISESQALGATPVLVTPVAQRYFNADNKTLTNKLRSYALAMIAVGAEENVPVIDLNAASVALIERLGPVDSQDLFIVKTDGTVDTTHFNVGGARQIAGMVVDGICEQVPELREYLVVPEPASLAMLMLPALALRRRSARH